LIYGLAFLISTQIFWKWVQYDENDYATIIPLVSLDGFLISVLLASTPELIKLYKKKHCNHATHQFMDHQQHV